MEYYIESIYLIHYVKGESLYLSYWEIRSIDDDSYKIKYFVETDKRSSGAPILNLRTKKIIGVHINHSHKYNFSNGTILKFL